MLPALDRERVADLFGDDVAEMRAFLVSTAALLRSRCERLAEVSEPHEMREIAHEVRGAALNVGAVDLAAALKSVEFELQTTQKVSSAGLDAMLRSCAAFEMAAENVRREEPSR